jgi:glycosyltransferase involved in cell wall biosynthesis
MKVLHITSWYPQSKDPFDGDFVERQLKALSLLMPVDVIHVVQKFHLLQNENGHLEEKQEGALHSTVYFPSFPKVKSITLQKLLFAPQYNRTIKKSLKDYIQQNGLPDLIHVHVPVKAGYAALYMKRKYGIPFVVTEHSSAYYEHMPENYFKGSRYFRFITKQSFEKAAAVSSVSYWLLKRLQHLFSVSTTATIRNVVDTKLFFPVSRQASVKRFIHVSMMIPLKNAEGIVDALYLLQQKTNEWEMVFVGDAPVSLRKKAEGLGAKVSFTGNLPYEKVAAEMQQADALVHFSNYENLPCVINEALCCGLPVISSDVGGINEILNSGNGILVESNNTIELAKAMYDFLNQNNQFNGTQISKDAASNFSYKKIAEEMMNLYRAVLKKN